MANSKAGQYRLEFSLQGYTAPIRSHVCGIWVQPSSTPSVGDLPTDIDIQLLGGSTAKLDVVALDYANRIRPLYNTAITIGTYTLWRYVTNYSRDFIASDTVTPTATGSGSITIAGQLTLTFRHAGGSPSRHTFLESNVSGDTQNALVANASGNSIQKYAAWVLSATSPVVGIDNTFPVATLSESRGQNEKVWRKIYRS